MKNKMNQSPLTFTKHYRNSRNDWWIRQDGDIVGGLCREKDAGVWVWFAWVDFDDGQRKSIAIPDNVKFVEARRVVVDACGR
tara:strand:- start:616 stop:861 length:246 start_codon:yes stop_codon:yes gene_type:complete